MLRILLLAMFEAAVAASAVTLALVCIKPQLDLRRARWPAYVAVYLAAATTLVLLVVDDLVWFPSLVGTIPMMFLIAVWFFPDVLARVTGGSVPLAERADGLVAAGVRVWERYQVGDLPGALREIERGDAAYGSTDTAYLALWRRLIGEEEQRRAGIEVASQETVAGIAREARALSTRGTPPRLRVSTGIIALAAIVAVSDAFVDGRACLGLELLLPGEPAASAGSLPALSGALLSTPPEPGSTLQLDFAMDLEAAAESRFDPDTRDQLLDEGFVAGHARVWQASDGRKIQADVLDFASADGALAFHRNVNRYACRFANEAFGGPLGGVGLQVRYGRGDPIEEQISFVVGTRRYLVSIRALEAPSDHEHVLRLADSAVTHLGQAAP